MSLFDVIGIPTTFIIVYCLIITLNQDDPRILLFILWNIAMGGSDQVSMKLIYVIECQNDVGT